MPVLPWCIHIHHHMQKACEFYKNVTYCYIPLRPSLAKWLGFWGQQGYLCALCSLSSVVYYNILLNSLKPLSTRFSVWDIAVTKKIAHAVWWPGFESRHGKHSDAVVYNWLNVQCLCVEKDVPSVLVGDCQVKRFELVQWTSHPLQEQMTWVRIPP
jgi:hypothetical protein